MASGRLEVCQLRAGQVAWRLLSNNHRDVGRSAGVFTVENGNLAAVALLRVHAAEATRIVCGTDRGMWSWRLRHEITP